MFHFRPKIGRNIKDLDTIEKDFLINIRKIIFKKSLLYIF